MKITFSESGMSREQLLEVASKYLELDVKEQDWYGHGRILREYGLFPQVLDLKVFLPHGISQWDHLPSYITRYANGYELFYSKRTAELFNKATGIKAEIIEAPFILYKNLNGVRVRATAKGSLVYPSHSTHDIAVDFNINQFCNELHKLPDTFKPIHICLYYLDVIKGHHNAYLDLGFPVHCVGNKNNSDFIHNWYELATNFKYGLGNEIGSHMFYLVDIGIPYSLFGSKPKYVNHSCKETAPIGEFDYQHSQINLCREIFKGIHFKVNEEQINLTKDELGIGIGKSRLEVSLKLYKAWIKLYVLNNIKGWIYKAFPFTKKMKGVFNG